MSATTATNGRRQGRTFNLNPAEFEANWARRPAFVWSDVDRPDDAWAFGLYVLRHRDSGLIDQSNAATIAAALAPFEAVDDVVRLTCGHFGFGWTEEVAVRVFRADDAAVTTLAFDTLGALVGHLATYPILDEDDYAARSLEAAHESIRFALVGSGVDCDTLPDGWETRVYRWLSRHAPEQVEDRDDRGPSPDDESVVEALTALCLIAPLDA